jgi:hypothetical protein
LLGSRKRLGGDVVKRERVVVKVEKWEEGGGEFVVVWEEKNLAEAQRF